MTNKSKTTKSSRNSETDSYESLNHASSDDNSSSIASDNTSTNVNKETLNKLLARMVALENKNKELEFQATKYQNLQSNKKSPVDINNTSEKRVIKEKKMYKKQKTYKKIQESSLEES